MKAITAILVTIAFLNAQASELEDQLIDFANLFPINDVYDIMLDYVQNDNEVKSVFEFLHTDEYKQLLIQLEALPEFINILNFIQTYKIRAYELVNIYNKIKHIDPMQPTLRTARSSSGVQGMLADITALLPDEQIKAMYEEKVKHSPEYSQWVQAVKGERFNELVQKLKINDVFKNIESTLAMKHVSLASVLNFVYKVFGWGYY